MANKNYKKGMKIEYPPHGQGEILGIGKTVKLHFPTQNLTIDVPFDNIVNDQRIKPIENKYDTGAMLEILMNYKSEIKILDEEQINKMLNEYNDQETVISAKQIVTIWDAKPADYQSQVRIEKLEKSLTNILADFMIIHLMEFDKYITKKQAEEKILNYKVLRERL